MSAVSAASSGSSPSRGSRPGRTHDEDGLVRRAAALAYEGSYAEGTLRVLLVASSRYPDQWILPGGGIEAGESDAAAAAREAHEEGGVVPAGEGTFLAAVTNPEKRARTQIFAMRVARLDEEYEDAGRRERTWASLQRAQELLQGMPSQAACLSAACAALTWL